MSNRSPLHITTHEYQEMSNNERQLEAFLREFFCVSPNDTQYEAIRELVQNIFRFSRAHLASIDAACALLTLVADLHELNVSRTVVTYGELQKFAKRRLIAYSLECPPFYTAFFEIGAIKAVAEFIDYFYTRNYKLWRYLFCPVPVLEIKAKKVLDLIEIQSLLQLGYSEEAADAAAEATTAVTAAATAGTTPSAAKSGASSTDVKPRSSVGERPGVPGKKGQPVAEVAPAPVAPSRIVLPFNSVPLSLSEATLYVPPPPKSEEEIVAEEIREQIAEAYPKEETPEGEQKEEVDVERLAKVIETATAAELDKVRTRMLAELENSGGGALGKKDGKK